MHLLPPYVAAPIEDLRDKPIWNGCCVPLAVAMAIRGNFRDVAVAMRAMRILDKRGGVVSSVGLPKFFALLGVPVAVKSLRLEAMRLAGPETYLDTVHPPTLVKYFPQLNGLNRHVLTKHNHAVYPDRLTGKVYDHRGVFPERRCRMTYHFELTIEQCATAKENLTGWLEAYYNRQGISRDQAIAAMTFTKKRAARRRMGVSSNGQDNSL